MADSTNSAEEEVTLAEVDLSIQAFTAALQNSDQHVEELLDAGEAEELLDELSLLED